MFVSRTVSDIFSVQRRSEGFQESGPHRAALARGAANVADGAKFLPRDAIHKRRAVSVMMSVRPSRSCIMSKQLKIVAVECEKETVNKLSSGTIFNDLE